MIFTTRVEDGSCVVSLGGRLDTVTSPACEEKFRDLVSAGHLAVVIDLATLDYISSIGLRVLLQVARQLKERNGKVCLANATHNVMSVFEMTNFTRILLIKSSVDEALESMREKE